MIKNQSCHLCFILQRCLLFTLSSQGILSWWRGWGLLHTGMPNHLTQYAKKDLLMGTIVMIVHMLHHMTTCVWFDGCSVHFHSTSFDLVALGCTMIRWVSGRANAYLTSSVQKEYLELTRGVDVLDQCHVEYTAQIMSYKYWHMLLFFILDTSLGNAYVLYKTHYMKRYDKGHPQCPMSIFDFYYKVAS